MPTNAFKAKLFYFLAVVLFVASAQWAGAIDITQVEGKFECPDLSNQQSCANRFEEAFLVQHAGLVQPGEDALEIRLQSGELLQLKRFGGFNLLELDESGRFLTLREQFSEGNTWHLVDLDRGIITEIFGYPLFSPNGTKFVCASEDLDAGWSVNAFDVYQITPQGIMRVFQAMSPGAGTWAGRDVHWIDDQRIGFQRAEWRDNHIGEDPAILQFSEGMWRIDQIN